MSKEKYASIFAKSNGGYRVYYPSNIFHNMRSYENWGIFLDIPQFWLGNIQSHDAHKQKYLMEHKS